MMCARYLSHISLNRATLLGYQSGCSSWGQLDILETTVEPISLLVTLEDPHADQNPLRYPQNVKTAAARRHAALPCEHFPRKVSSDQRKDQLEVCQ
jgi:hypothetical protein